MNNNIIASKDVLIYAFRYSLGRMTYAPVTVCETIKSNIKNLSKYDLNLLIDEINNCQNYGMDFDKSYWLGFLRYLDNELNNKNDNKIDVAYNNIIINREILIFAFRYSLHESKSEISIIENAIKDNIDKISIYDINLFLREIKEYISYDINDNSRYFVDLKNFLEKKLL